MFRSKTLFVVGAGASNEASLPNSKELARKIADKLDIQVEQGYKQISGSYLIPDAIRRPIPPHNNYRDINSYLDAAWAIRDAMPQALSIDNYLDAHSSDEKIELCGKLAIVECILEAERQSRLFFKLPEASGIDMSGLNETWYANFFQLLTENVRKEDVGKVFENVSFIVFNYDRCIEHFLVYATANYYRITIENAQQLVSKLTLLHPYGVVGRLPWQEPLGISFGAQINGAKLLEASAQLKTFSQRIEDESALSKMRKLVEEAQSIVFLGFAFHEPNMELIKPARPSDVQRIFGTAVGFSQSVLAVVENDLLAALQRSSVSMNVRRDLTCKKLIEEYWRSLAR
jgi:hypothetical protein